MSLLAYYKRTQILGAACFLMLVGLAVAVLLSNKDLPGSKDPSDRLVVASKRAAVAQEPAPIASGTGERRIRKVATDFTFEYEVGGRHMSLLGNPRVSYDAEIGARRVHGVCGSRKRLSLVGLTGDSVLFSSQWAASVRIDLRGVSKSEPVCVRFTATQGLEIRALGLERPRDMRLSISCPLSKRSFGSNEVRIPAADLKPDVSYFFPAMAADNPYSLFLRYMSATREHVVWQGSCRAVEGKVVDVRVGPSPGRMRTLTFQLSREVSHAALAAGLRLGVSYSVDGVVSGFDIQPKSRAFRLALQVDSVVRFSIEHESAGAPVQLSFLGLTSIPASTSGVVVLRPNVPLVVLSARSMPKVRFCASLESPLAASDYQRLHVFLRSAWEDAKLVRIKIAGEDAFASAKREFARIANDVYAIPRSGRPMARVRVVPRVSDLALEVGLAAKIAARDSESWGSVLYLRKRRSFYESGAIDSGEYGIAWFRSGTRMTEWSRVTVPARMRPFVVHLDRPRLEYWHGRVAGWSDVHARLPAAVTLNGLTVPMNESGEFRLRSTAFGVRTGSPCALTGNGGAELSCTASVDAERREIVVTVASHGVARAVLEGAIAATRISVWVLSRSKQRIEVAMPLIPLGYPARVMGHQVASLRGLGEEVVFVATQRGGPGGWRVLGSTVAIAGGRPGRLVLRGRWVAIFHPAGATVRGDLYAVIRGRSIWIHVLEGTHARVWIPHGVHELVAVSGTKRVGAFLRDEESSCRIGR